MFKILKCVSAEGRPNHVTEPVHKDPQVLCLLTLILIHCCTAAFKLIVIGV